MNGPITILHYWCGCPSVANSKWQRFLHLIQACARRGWRNYLVWTRLPDDESLWRPFVNAGCEIVIQRRPPHNFSLRCILDTFHLVRRLNCQIFHCHNVHTSPPIGAALAKVPVRLWSKLAMDRSYEEGEQASLRTRVSLSVRLSVRLCHHVLAVSQAVSGELLRHNVPRGRVSVHPGGIELLPFGRRNSGAFRTSGGLREADLLITTVGHAIPVKGWDIAIRAFAAVSRTCPQARLVLVGSTDSGPERGYSSRMRDLAHRAGVSDLIRFTGVRCDVPDILADTDIFILPSRSEGHPNALKEAMAAGLPCVAANVGGVPELITDNDTGLMFMREDADGLAERILRLVQDPDLRLRLGRSARLYAQQFGLEDTTARVISVYIDLLKKRLVGSVEP